MTLRLTLETSQYGTSDVSDRSEVQRRSFGDEIGIGSRIG